MPDGYRKAQKGDIELPAERGRDSRLPKKPASVRQSLEALKRIVPDAKRRSEEFQRRNR